MLVRRRRPRVHATLHISFDFTSARLHPFPHTMASQIAIVVVLLVSAILGIDGTGHRFHHSHHSPAKESYGYSPKKPAYPPPYAGGGNGGGHSESSGGHHEAKYFATSSDHFFYWLQRMTTFAFGRERIGKDLYISNPHYPMMALFSSSSVMRFGAHTEPSEVSSAPIELWWPAKHYTLYTLIAVGQLRGVL